MLSCIKALPDKYKNVNLQDVVKAWKFVKEEIRLIVETYRDSLRNTENNKQDFSWAKGFRIEKLEDFNPASVCLRAREECKKKYSKSNLPKLPFHIGCNCNMETMT